MSSRSTRSGGGGAGARGPKRPRTADDQPQPSTAPSAFSWLAQLVSGKRINNNSRRDGFEANPTPFGKILRGELPAHILHEDHDVLCFRDIAPVQEFHALVIPKRRIEHCGCVGHSDVPLLRHMEAVALQALQAEYPALDNLAYVRNDGVLPALPPGQLDLVAQGGGSGGLGNITSRPQNMLRPSRVPSPL